MRRSHRRARLADRSPCRRTRSSTRPSSRPEHRLVLSARSTATVKPTRPRCRLSSVFWLGQTALRGMGARSLTAQNLLDTGDCVITLLAAELVDAGDRIALTTGHMPVPPGMALVGYRHEPDKIARAGLHSRPGDPVRAERIDECPVNHERAHPRVHPCEKFEGSHRSEPVAAADHEPPALPRPWQRVAPLVPGSD